MDIHIRLRRASDYTPPPDALHPLIPRLSAHSQASDAVINTEVLATGVNATEWFRHHLGALPTVHDSPLTKERLEDQLHHGTLITLQHLDWRPHPSSRADRPEMRAHSSATTSLILSIDHGPDMGKTFTLGRGTYTLGRGATNIRLADARISREHASIELGGTHARLHAAPRTPPILVNGQITTSTELRSGDRIHLGATEITVLSPAELMREFRLPGPPATPQLIKSQPSQNRKLVLLLGALLPLILGVVMAVVFESWFFLAFSAIGAITALMGIFSARGGKKYSQEIAAASNRFEARRREATIAPHLLGLQSPGRPPDSGLVQSIPAQWSASISLGAANTNAPLHFADMAAIPEADLPVLKRLPMTLDLNPGVFVTVETGETGSAGNTVPTPRFNVVAQLSALWRIGKLPRVIATSTSATWLHPLQFVGGITIAPSETLATVSKNSGRIFVTNTPECLADVLTSADAVIAFVDQDFADLGPRETDFQGTRIRDTGIRNPGSLTSGASSGSRVHVSLRGEHSLLIDPRQYGAPQSFTADAMSAARLLDSCTPTAYSAQLEARTNAATELPEVITLAALLPPRIPINAAVTLNHAGNAGNAGNAPSQLGSTSVEYSTRFPIGLSMTGTVELDLERDGPHFLIAGTTGSGKSELLRSMILSLAQAASPRDVNFLMIDFKGGAALAPFAPLPHFAGIVTDLGLESIERTLECLRAEIRHRKRLFAALNAADLHQYRRCADPQDQIARLVIVVDEFRMLSDASPAAVTELMRIATIGRSLGLNLILCTQRPQGAMNADIRANITTAIALRMAHQAESIDVIGNDWAAAISSRTPGRAYLKIAHTEPIEFQSASSASTDTADRLGPTAVQHFSTWLRSAPGPATTLSTDSLATAIDAVVEQWHQNLGHDDGSDFDSDDFGNTNLGGADLGSTEHGSSVHGSTKSAVRFPVTEPLPDSLLNTAFNHPQEVGQSGIPLGIQDLPFEQRRALVYWEPSVHSHLALIGSPASGVSRVAFHLMTQVLEFDPDSRVYVMDGDRTLDSLGPHPSIAGYQNQESVIDAGNFAQRLHTLAVEGLREPGSVSPMYLFITGWSSWSALFRQGRYTWIEDKLIELSRPAYRRIITIVTTGERELITSKLSAEANNRIILSYGRPEEMTMLLPKMPHIAELPGRGYLQGSLVNASSDNPFPGTTIQLYERDPNARSLDTSTTATISSSDRISPLPTHVSAPPPATVGPAQVGTAVVGPALVDPASVGQVADANGQSWQTPAQQTPAQQTPAQQTGGQQTGGQGDGWVVPIGVAAYPTRDFTLRIDPESLTLIVGASASGKTTLLTHLATQVLGTQVVTQVGARVGPTVGTQVGPETLVWNCHAPATASMLGALLVEIRAPDLSDSSARPAVLALDDIDRLPAASQQHLADLAQAGVTILASVTNRPGLFARCPVTLGARGGNGVVLLGPDKAGDAEAFGYRLDTEYPTPCGRAFILGGATPVAVQTYAPTAQLSKDVA